MILQPIVPFEPVSTDRFPQGDHWIAQIKWDGVRMLFYYDGTEMRLINRKLNDRTRQYPEFLNPHDFCSATSFILDGELIAIRDDRPSFHEIMKRESLRKEASIQLAVNRIPVTYMVFDVLFCNGEWLLNKKLSERQQILTSLIKPFPSVQVVQNIHDPESLYRVMKAHQMEGVVCKDLGSTYTPGEKDTRWQKRKIFHDLYAVVGGVTYRGNIVNALLLGLYDHGKLVYIGHAGTGKLSQEDWRQITREAESLKSSEKPFFNNPERSKDAVWLTPRLVVKVQFLEWTPGKTMRHPSIQTFVEMDPAECTSEQTI